MRCPIYVPVKDPFLKNLIGPCGNDTNGEAWCAGHITMLQGARWTPGLAFRLPTVPMYFAGGDMSKREVA